MAHPGHRHHERGQVLIAGVFILIILLLTIIAGFDIYNTIRAKYKVETAQEAAALAGASWQRDSLNLIGEINLVKACSILLEDDDNWVIPLPQRRHYPFLSANAFQLLRTQALQARIDVLTQMQTRISFIGPLIGLAAAQQAAKANGIPVVGNFDHYIRDLRESSRYRPEYGGAAYYINDYAWKEPYIDLIRTISASGVAVYPNARTGNSPSVYPPQLKSESFYTNINAHAEEIAEADFGILPYNSRLSWRDSTINFTLGDKWAARFANPPWWEIDYSQVSFPNESEVFTLGLSTTGNRDAFTAPRRDHLLYAAQKAKLASHIRENIYDDENGPPSPDNVSLKFFSYDDTWYPSYYRGRHPDYDEYHYNYWFTGDVLRKHVKPQYRYEGPAAYVETHADVGKVSSLFRVSGQYRSGSSSTRIGSRRASGSVDDLTEYRPGTIAKPLGELADNSPPITLPLVLPVFDKVILMPTYMPIPYNFGVLHSERSMLRIFLGWLSSQDDLEDKKHSLPSGCDAYLAALRHLVQGKEFRYYGWNPGFDESDFDRKWKKDPVKWHQERMKNPEHYQYSFKAGDRTLPGFLQEPRIFSGTIGKGVITVEDHINGGYAQRHYVSGNTYIVVNSKGHIVNNNEVDPTLDYSSIGGGSGGGNGFNSHGNGYNSQRGPRRQ